MAQYQVALDALENTCVRQAGTSHGDYAITVKRLLSDEGVSMSALEILRGVAQAAPSIQGLPCPDAYTLFATLVVSDS